MVLTNLSVIKEDSLIAVANPVPFSIVVDSQQPATVVLNIYKGNSNTNLLVGGIEMLKYRSSAPFQYFTCDLRDILSLAFENLDDVLQGAFSWQDMNDFIQDIYMEINITNTANETLSTHIGFTIANVSRQYGESILICDSPDNIYDTCKLEKIYVGVNNIGYIYVYTNSTDQISMTEDNNNYFVDSDDIYFTDYNDSLFFEK